MERNIAVIIPTVRQERKWRKDFSTPGCTFLYFHLFYHPSFIRLFVGMGLNWYLEIVGWAMVSDMEDSLWQVLPDCINMLQVGDMLDCLIAKETRGYLKRHAG